MIFSCCLFILPSNFCYEAHLAASALLIYSLSMQPISYERKADYWFFSELDVS
jgi:hypothetical protein